MGSRPGFELGSESNPLEFVVQGEEVGEENLGSNGKGVLHQSPGWLTPEQEMQLGNEQTVSGSEHSKDTGKGQGGNQPLMPLSKPVPTKSTSDSTIMGPDLHQNKDNDKDEKKQNLKSRISGCADASTGSVVTADDLDALLSNRSPQSSGLGQASISSLKITATSSTDQTPKTSTKSHSHEQPDLGQVLTMVSGLAETKLDAMDNSVSDVAAIVDDVIAAIPEMFTGGEFYFCVSF